MSHIEKSVCVKLLSRAKIGLEKYGVTMERTDLSRLDWLQHAQEEALDFAVYLEKLITLEYERSGEDIEGNPRDNKEGA